MSSSFYIWRLSRRDRVKGILSVSSRCVSSATLLSGPFRPQCAPLESWCADAHRFGIQTSLRGSGPIARLKGFPQSSAPCELVQTSTRSLFSAPASPRLQGLGETPPLAPCYPRLRPAAFGMSSLREKELLSVVVRLGRVVVNHLSTPIYALLQSAHPFHPTTSPVQKRSGLGAGRQAPLPVYLRQFIAPLNSIVGEATPLTDKVAFVNHIPDIAREDANTRWR